MNAKPSCELCEKNPASVHYTEIADGQVSKLFLCRSCAADRGLLEEPADVEALLSTLKPGAAAPPSEPGPPPCARCGLAFAEFQEEGRLGCPGCYETFETQMHALLQRIHPGKRHQGKRPGAPLGPMPQGARLEDLRRQLERAVGAEQYERAAELRDRIRAAETAPPPVPAPVAATPAPERTVRCVADLLRRPSLWLRGDGPESDVVLSTRVRFARNVASWHFPQRCDADQRARALREILQQADGLALPAGELRLELEPLPTMERRILGERHLLSPEGVEAPANRAVVIAGDESVSFMVNEEDHLRIQSLRCGLDLQGALEAGDRLESSLGARLEYAFSDVFGFLTACPTNVGTGLRASVLLHLPGLVLEGRMESELLSLQARGVTVRGFHGEGSKALGNLFQVSNGATLGRSEAEILTGLEEVVLDLLAKEKQARESLLTGARTLLEDRIWRSFGVLRHARKLTAQETLQHGSMLRLGCHVQILELPRDVLDEILTLGQEAHTEFLAGGNGDASQRSAWRAATIRKRLESSQNGSAG